MTKLSVLFTSAFMLTFSFTAIASAGEKDVIDTAMTAGNFKTLVAAVQAAGLAQTLKGPGPFTVFAPTDAAFAKLPEGTVQNLLKPESKDKLVAILTYHVVPGNVMSNEAAKMSGAKTLNGQDIKIMASDGKVMVNDAQVVKADIKCSNGFIHAIDSVLIPQ
ncbi:MAG: fasciclin domain-containing protein [Bryobacteraceae bacterium]